MRLLAGSILIVCLNALAQSSPSFEVASVKINTSNSGFSESSTENGRFVGTNLSLKGYIRSAYGVNDFEVAGPAWIDEDRFDIHAIPPNRVDTNELMAMLKSLLADRFNLQIHKETKVFSAYGLVIAKSGLKVKEVDDSAGDGSTNNGRGDLIVHNASMKRFAEVLSRQTNRPVIDKTGRTGVFDFELKWSEDDSGPSLFTAIQEQLGMRLSAGKFPMEIFSRRLRPESPHGELTPIAWHGGADPESDS